MKQEELDDQLYQKIVKLSQKGDQHIENDDFVQAIQSFQEAFDLVPEPYQEWEASTWILFSLGETYFFDEQYEEALSALQDAMHCPGAIGNPLIHFRLGQVQFELSNFDRAKDELLRAYMSEGEEIFDGEDEKYFAFLNKEVKL